MENKQIAAAFVKAKMAFGPALKAQVNGAFKNKYADLGACIDAVDDALLANGIALIQETFMDDTGVTVETVFMHESGETIRGGKLHVPAAKHDPQGYGSALTYCRRYSLQAACGIAPEDDDGNAATKAVQKPVQVDIEPWIKKMDEATSAKELKAIALQAWEATNDDRIAAHHSKIISQRKALLAKAAEYEAQQAETNEEKKLRELAEATNG